MVESPEHKCGENNRYEVWDGDAEPHTFGTPKPRKYEQERDEEDELSAEWQENAGLRHTDTLEEMSYDDCESDEGCNKLDKTHAFYGELREFRVIGEKTDGQFWEEFAHNERETHHDCGIYDAVA